jgi:hypothetical protein
VLYGKLEELLAAAAREPRPWHDDGDADDEG